MGIPFHQLLNVLIVWPESTVRQIMMETVKHVLTKQYHLLAHHPKINVNQAAVEQY